MMDRLLSQAWSSPSRCGHKQESGPDQQLHSSGVFGLLAVVGTAGSSSDVHSPPWRSSMPPGSPAAAPVASNSNPLNASSIHLPAIETHDITSDT